MRQKIKLKKWWAKFACVGVLNELAHHSKPNKAVAF
jgi:hypothetical protein